MKNALRAFAVLAAVVSVHGYEDKKTDECETELGFQGRIVSIETYKKYYPCILACVHEKMGVMIDSKIIPEKYVSDYVPVTYNDYGEVYIPKLLECITEANDQEEKCAIERSLNKCLYANWRTIFPHDNDDV